MSEGYHGLCMADARVLLKPRHSTGLDLAGPRAPNLPTENCPVRFPYDCGLFPFPLDAAKPKVKIEEEEQSLPSCGIAFLFYSSAWR